VLPGAKKHSREQKKCSLEHYFLYNDKYGQSLTCQSPPSKPTANTAAAADLSPTPPPMLPTPSLPTAAGQCQMPGCHHLANCHRHGQCHRTNVAALPTTAYKEEIGSFARAQQCTHWEGEKFDVIMTTRSKTVAVAAATAMCWGG
jgi:hypothetical protein